MNYRHAFHAGNFADLVKHALLLALIAGRPPGVAPLTVVESHAGAGLYDLGDGPAQASREAQAGIGRLLAEPEPPAAFAPLVRIVRALNRGPTARLYPGSPLLAWRTLRRGDRWRGFELRREEAAALKALARREAPQGIDVQAEAGDGFAGGITALPAQGKGLLLIDPPFERGDDYLRSAELARAARARNPDVAVAIWTPLKDLDTFDRFLTALREAAAGGFAAQARLRPLSDPLKMNGCAMTVLGAPEAALSPPPSAATSWS